MKAKKFFSALFMTLMLLVASACGGDDDVDDGLYDWKITKTYYRVQGTDAKCEKVENEYLYDKSEEYVKLEKIKFESHSTKDYTYKYAYKKL
jgi:hypothetical protein